MCDIPALVIMKDRCISRRDLLGAGWNAAAAGVLSLAAPGTAMAKAGWYPPQVASLFGSGLGSFAASFDRAYSFLGEMMDAYTRISKVRFMQSYSDEQGLKSTGFIYDNAICIHAFLLRGSADDISRAQILGDALLHAQHNDALHDGRLRQAYSANAADAQGAYVRLAEAPFSFLGTSTGDMAWAGMALAQLYRSTGNGSYLTGAVSLGTWIFEKTYDTRGAGGFNGGVDASNAPITHKSTEHNVDAYALFLMLSGLTGNSDWSARARHAFLFIAAMWNSSARFFWTGTGNDGATLNTSNIPEDVQTWSYLALLKKAYGASLDWVRTNLKTSDTSQAANSNLGGTLRLEGLTFASQSLRAVTPSSPGDRPPDPHAVWLEGSAHGVAALLVRGCSSDQDRRMSSGDLTLALSLLHNIRLAQSSLGGGQNVGGAPIQSGGGIVAASSVCDTGFGSSYYPNLHIGATGWYLIAGQGGNPFQLGYGRQNSCPHVRPG